MYDLAPPQPPSAAQLTTSDRPSRPDWPLSGPIVDDDTEDDITGRFTALSADPALQRAFQRLDKRLDELSKRWESQRSDDLGSIRDELVNLDDKWSAQTGALRDDAARREQLVTDLRADLVEHDKADAIVHADLTGKGGKNGKIGRLEERQSATDRRIKWAAGIVASVLLAAAGGAWAAVREMNERAREAGRQDERERQQELRLDRVEGFLLGAGLNPRTGVVP